MTHTAKPAGTRYVVTAFDAKLNSLDITGSKDGEVCIPETLGELLSIVRTTKSGVLHDFDAETHTKKRIAFFAICRLGAQVTDELFVTAWGRKCKIRDRALIAETRWIGGTQQAPFYITNV